MKGEEVKGICQLCAQPQYEHSSMHTMACVRLRRLEKIVGVMAGSYFGSWGSARAADPDLHAAIKALAADLKEGR